MGMRLLMDAPIDWLADKISARVGTRRSHANNSPELWCVRFSAREQSRKLPLASIHSCRRETASLRPSTLRSIRSLEMEIGPGGGNVRP